MDWQKKSYSLTAGSHTLKWVYSKDSSGSAGEDCGWVDGLKVGTTSYVGQPDAMSEALDSQLKFTQSGTGTWYNVSGTSHEYYYEADAAESEASDDEEALLQAIVDSPNSETVKFYWKVSSEQSGPSTSLGTPALPRPKRTGCSERSFGCAQDACALAPRTTRDGVLGDYLQFYIDSTLKDQISGEVGWPAAPTRIGRRGGGQQKSYAVSSGIHILLVARPSRPCIRGGVPPLQHGPKARETQGQDALATAVLGEPLKGEIPLSENIEKSDL